MALTSSAPTMDVGKYIIIWARTDKEICDLSVAF
jgi:hypothetical protein